MTLDQNGESARRLKTAIDEELELLGRVRAIAIADISRLGREQAALGCHPNHLGYLFGGGYASRGMSAPHILPLAGWHRLPFNQAIDRLAQIGGGGLDNGDLLTTVRIACESDQSLEAAGFTWLGEIGLLKRGAVDRYWLKKPVLGLGQPARAHGLVREHHHGHRGLFTLDPADLRHRFAAAAPGQPDPTFGGLLQSVVERGGHWLAQRGGDAVHRDAKARYDADCASFVAHQAATDRRDWRGKPPLSRQGHLAVRTAVVRDIDMPAERTRGSAADWLNNSGANPRFRED